MMSHSYGYDVFAAAAAGWTLGPYSEVYIPGRVGLAPQRDGTDRLIALAKSGDMNAVKGLVESIKRRMEHGSRDRD